MIENRQINTSVNQKSVKLTFKEKSTFQGTTFEKGDVVEVHSRTEARRLASIHKGKVEIQID